ncbi:MAG: multidrug efflux SMR transporter [Alphaproteobacteria bacterium]
MAWMYLAIAIASEVFATSMLKLSRNAPSWWSVGGVVAGYGIAFVFLSLTFNRLPIGVAYAIWSGAGTALVAIVGWLAFKQSLAAAELIGISMIIAGVAVLRSGAAQP